VVNGVVHVDDVDLPEGTKVSIRVVGEEQDDVWLAAGLLTERGRPVDAARLFGVAESLRELIGRPLTRVKLTMHERDVATVQGQLAPEDFTTAWAEGRAMTLDQGLAYALEASAPA